MCAVHDGETLSRAMSVTVLSFLMSYTSPIGRRPLACGAPMMRCLPASVTAGTGPDVVSKTVIRPSPPVPTVDRSADVKYVSPPYEVDTKYNAPASADAR